jgi:DNA-directed RNA polymerase subunit RPC12/RpoP
MDIAGRTAVIITMHGKEELIEAGLAGTGLRFLPPPGIDTDRFGTFSGEIPRAGSQLDALLAKARAGLDAVADADFALASEGAFGPHPAYGFVPGGREMVVLLCRASALHVIGEDLTLDTNFASREARTAAEAREFADRIGFPDHGLLLAPPGGAGPFTKDMDGFDALDAAVAALLAAHGGVHLRTDMRAHRNPTRRRSIARAVADLALRLDQRCPDCAFPDWRGVLRPGRPCGWCDTPTLDSADRLYRCRSCGLERIETIDPDRKADPAHCPSCNP